jgi:RNA-directed DNA polymerase
MNPRKRQELRKWLRGRYLPRWWPTDGETTLLRPSTVTVTRYRYRGRSIPSPWTTIA